MSEFPACPKCKSPFTYDSGLLLTCPECAYEWATEEAKVEESANYGTLEVKDSNGVILEDGDTVTIIKDLPVKGFPRSIKAGTKVKNIRLVEGDHNIDCKVDGFGAMALKSIFVKKV